MKYQTLRCPSYLNYSSSININHPQRPSYLKTSCPPSSTGWKIQLSNHQSTPCFLYPRRSPPSIRKSFSAGQFAPIRLWWFFANQLWSTFGRSGSLKTLGVEQTTTFFWSFPSIFCCWIPPVIRGKPHFYQAKNLFPAWDEMDINSTAGARQEEKAHGSVSHLKQQKQSERWCFSTWWTSTLYGDQR